MKCRWLWVWCRYENDWNDTFLKSPCESKSRLTHANAVSCKWVSRNHHPPSKIQSRTSSTATWWRKRNWHYRCPNKSTWYGTLAGRRCWRWRDLRSTWSTAYLNLKINNHITAIQASHHPQRAKENHKHLKSFCCSGNIPNIQKLKSPTVG